ncbi:MAG: hypothetical protein Q9222_006661 [Ikaeria aurantiellina]
MLDSRHRLDPHRQQLPSSSSSSSTIIGTPPSPKDFVAHDFDEQTPLLSSTTSLSLGVWISRRIHSIVIYQPRPIPIVNKNLPSNGTSIVILAFIGLQVFYVFYRMPLSIPMLFVFADRTSLLFVANLPWLYLFAAKNQPIKTLTGYSYESLNILHRRLGEVMCLLALLHSIGMVGVWYTLLRPTGFTLARFLLSKIILLGLGALAAYELIYWTSLGSFRQRWYELFLFLHVSLQFIALVLVWFHHHGGRPYIGAALAIFLIDRLVYRMGLKTSSSRALLEVTKDEGTMILSAQLPVQQNSSLTSCFTNVRTTNGWKATEHVFLTVPALSRKHFIQAHPFTIASKQPAERDGKAELKLIIRAQNGFSGDLLKYARDHLLASIRLDGPYGSQKAVDLLKACDLSVIVAGGSGIAVALPLAWAAHDAHDFLDLENNPKVRPRAKVLMIWVIRDQSHRSWVDSSEFQVLRDNGTDIIVPPPTSDHGHPDIPGMITSWILARDAGQGLRTGIVCSGPDPMNRAVRNACASLLTRGHDVDVEVEKFGW